MGLRPKQAGRQSLARGKSDQGLAQVIIEIIDNGLGASLPGIQVSRPRFAGRPHEQHLLQPGMIFYGDGQLWGCGDMAMVTGNEENCVFSSGRGEGVQDFAL